ncbi:hypothetical protein GCM10008929_16190 [Alkalibacterium psychrotolerans]
MNIFLRLVEIRPVIYTFVCYNGIVNDVKEEVTIDDRYDSDKKY